MSGHARIEELIAAYVLDSLEGPEALETSRDLLDHLSSCPSCAQLFRDLRETASEFALATPTSPVTPAFHDRVMVVVRAENLAVTVSDRQRRRFGWSNRDSPLLRGLLAASVTVFIGLGGLSAHLSSRLSDTQVDGRQGEQALAFVNDPSTRLIRMAGSREVGRMSLAAHPDGRAVLIGSDLRLPQDRLFEIWSLRGSESIPVGTFAPVDGHALVDLRLDPDRDVGLAVTIERQRVERPTTKPVFEGSLRA